LRVQTSAGRVDGLQSETVRAVGRVGQLSIIFFNGVAYIHANALGLRSLVGFTTAASSSEAGHWISVRRSRATAVLYDLLTSGMTVASTAAELALPGTLSLVPLTMVHGQRVLGIKAKSPGTSKQPATQEVLYVRAGRSPLPVEADETIGGSTARVVFGPWGERPAVSAPPRPVPLLISWLADPSQA
jgi:hypothetical protein